MSSFEITFHAHGPMFDGRAQVELTNGIAAVVSSVADQASADVHSIADLSFKHPTPYYETQIHRFRRGRTEVVNDRGIVYGPWLEGVGSRNRTTRFKGYHLWRLATEDARAAVPRIAAAELPRYLQGMR